MFEKGHMYIFIWAKKHISKAEKVAKKSDERKMPVLVWEGENK